MNVGRVTSLMGNMSGEAPTDENHVFLGMAELPVGRRRYAERSAGKVGNIRKGAEIVISCDHWHRARKPPALDRAIDDPVGHRADERRGMDIYGPIYGYICLYGYLWI